MNISKVEEFIGYNIAKDILKQSAGDGLEFEMMYQAILDSMGNESNIDKEASDENSSSYYNLTTSSNSMRIDDMDLILMNNSNDIYGRNPIDYMISKSNNNISNSINLYSDVINNLQNINNNDKSTTEELTKIYATVEKYCKQYGVDKNLVLAIIKQESNFDPNAASHAGAKGLMQLMDFNSEAYGITNPFDIDENIEGGVKHIKSYLDMYDGDVEMALMAYNGGPGTMSRRGVTSAADLYKMPEETQNYVPKVINYYKNGFNL